MFGDSLNVLTGISRVERDLHEARAISQVDKNEAAEIPAAVNPSAKPDGLPHMFLPKRSALVRA